MRRLFLIAIISFTASVWTTTSISKTRTTQSAPKGENVEEIRSLESEINSLNLAIACLKEKIDFWDTLNIIFICFAFMAAGGLVVASIALRNKNGQLEISRVALNKAKDSLASLQLGNINLSAQQAKERAEEEHLARVRIEEKLAGWKLEAEAQERIINKLKPYKTTPFDLGAIPTEVVFMETMDSILLSAGWKRQIPKSDNPLGQILLDSKARINYVSGIYVELAPSRVGDLGPAADELVKALCAEGIPARGQIAAKETDTSAIHLVIGSK